MTTPTETTSRFTNSRTTGFTRTTGMQRPAPTTGGFQKRTFGNSGSGTMNTGTNQSTTKKPEAPVRMMRKGFGEK